MGPIGPGRGLGGLGRAWPRSAGAGDHSVAAPDGRPGAACIAAARRARRRAYRAVRTAHRAGEPGEPGRDQARAGGERPAAAAPADLGALRRRARGRSPGHRGGRQNRRRRLARRCARARRPVCFRRPRRAAARCPRGRPRLHHHGTIEAGDAAPEDPDPGRSGGAGDHRDAGHRHRLRCHAASRGGQGLHRHRLPARNAENCQHGERAARRMVFSWRRSRSRRTRQPRHRFGERFTHIRDAARLGEGRGDRKLNGALQRAFAADGPLAARVAGFKLRPQQLEMAAAIHAAIERTGVLVAEAGTGTGKTFAYLVPALLAGGKVIVSTGTKTLQDQLYDRDLPAVREALACGTTAALLKGRANYVCLYRMKRAAGDARLELRAAGGASPELDRVATRLDKAARDLRLALGEPGARLAWTQALRLPDFPGALEKLQASLKELERPLAEQAERSEGLASCARRAGGAVAVLARMGESEGQAEVRWVEVHGHAAQLHVTPLSSAELFRRQM